MEHLPSSSQATVWDAVSHARARLAARALGDAAHAAAMDERGGPGGLYGVSAARIERERRVERELHKTRSQQMWPPPDRDAPGGGGAEYDDDGAAAGAGGGNASLSATPTQRQREPAAAAHVHAPTLSQFERELRHHILEASRQPARDDAGYGTPIWAQ